MRNANQHVAQCVITQSHIDMFSSDSNDVALKLRWLSNKASQATL
jgi:hypothetical protein